MIAVIHFQIICFGINSTFNSCSSAMVNTVYTIGKIRRLGRKLLMSGGYIDSRGKRRRPPAVVTGIILAKFDSVKSYINV